MSVGSIDLELGSGHAPTLYASMGKFSKVHQMWYERSSDVQVRQLTEDLRQLMGDRRSLMEQVRQIGAKRKKARQKCSRAPKSVKVAMDESQFPPYFGDGSSETQRRSAPLFLTSAISTSGRPPPPVSSAPVAGGLPSFTFPANYGYLSPSSMEPTGFFVHPAPPLPSLPSDLFPFHRAELVAPGSWDAGSSSSWFPASVQQPNIPATLQWDDPSIQPDWDDLVSSFQPAAARTPSTGLSAGDLPNDSYDIDLLMANISSVFSSAPPSSIPEDDDWSSRIYQQFSAGGHLAVHVQFRRHHRGPTAMQGAIGHPPFVSVEIEQWDGTNWATADLPCIEADVPLADEALNMDARLGWDFKPSNVKWLDPDVSSEVAEFPQGTRLTEKNKIYAFHRVTGCPSRFPFFRQRTGFLINLTDVKGMNSDQETTVDKRIRDQDSHSWGRSTGARNKPDAYVPGSFFGLSSDIKIAKFADLGTRVIEGATWTVDFQVIARRTGGSGRACS
ncbi:hypothetical protein B0H14DRAFT_3698937 [Mycena olivaceomarginata]|nr:hypothetical protein B0H14DRAFT_3698937 [Mycena olivaceomarginata]